MSLASPWGAARAEGRRTAAACKTLPAWDALARLNAQFPFMHTTRSRSSIPHRIAPTESATMATRADQIGQMRSLMSEKGNQPGWDQAWKLGVTPWETMHQGEVQAGLQWACEMEPSLAEMLPRNDRQAKVLVPGCGRGQDVVYFALQRGLHAIGIDISETAVEKAQAYVAQRAEQAKDEQATQVIRQHAQVVQADYLDPNSQTGPHRSPLLQGADVVYDFTFLCALPPSLRGQWVDANHAALRSGGLLFCIVYPIPAASGMTPDGNPVDPNVGPPYPLNKDLYRELLQSRFTLAFEGIPANLPEDMKGRQEVMIWRKV